MTSISLVEKDSIVTTPDPFKDRIFACKIVNHIAYKFPGKKSSPSS